MIWSKSPSSIVKLAHCIRLSLLVMKAWGKIQNTIACAKVLFCIMIELLKNSDKGRYRLYVILLYTLNMLLRKLKVTSKIRVQEVRRLKWVSLG